MAATTPDLGLAETLQRARARGHPDGLLAALASRAREHAGAGRAAAQPDAQGGTGLDARLVRVSPLADVLPISECRRMWVCPVRNGSARAVSSTTPGRWKTCSASPKRPRGCLGWCGPRARGSGPDRRLAEGSVRAPGQRIRRPHRTCSPWRRTGSARVPRTHDLDRVDGTSLQRGRAVCRRAGAGCWKAGASDIHFEPRAMACT